MKKVMILICLTLCALLLAGCSQKETTIPSVTSIPVSSADENQGKSGPSRPEISPEEEPKVSQAPVISTEEQEENNMISLQIGDRTLTAELADNSSAQAFTELLREGPVTVQMSDYGNFEKVGPLPASLPENNEQITTEPGDIILYQGNSITVYYAENTWNFTRLGRVQDVTGEALRAILGEGDVEITFSLPPAEQ